MEAPHNLTASPCEGVGFDSTLRDWFAGQALVEFAGLVSVREPGTMRVVAGLSYAMADAMLAERRKAAVSS